MIRCMKIALICCLLPSCSAGDSEEALDPGQVNLEQEVKPEPEPSLVDAIDFLESRLGRQQLGSTTWSPLNIELRGKIWSWTENTISEGETALDVSILSEHSEVDPSLLSVPSVASGRSVEIECLASKCIQVEVAATSVARALVNSENLVTSYEERLNKATWHSSSEEEALRIARALTDALFFLGAKESNY